MRAALENRLPTQIKLLARILRDEKFSGYDGIGARWGSMLPQARDAFICVEIKFQAPHAIDVAASARWREATKVKQPNLSMISTQAFIAKMERDYNASDAKKNATSFHLANVEMSRDPLGPVGVRRGSELAFGPTDADAPRAYAIDASIF